MKKYVAQNEEQSNGSEILRMGLVSFTKWNDIENENKREGG